MRRTVLIVSPYFPPSQLAGVHRARHLAKHLPAAGWTPIVLCVDEAFHEQQLDPALASLVPDSVEVLKVRAVPAAMTRPFGLGDITLRAWSALRAKLMAVLASRQVDVVLITAAPYYSLLLARLIKRRTTIPVVLDFQDPWVSQWGAGQAPLGKAGLSHRIATWLEPRAVRVADFVTSVSEVQNGEMIARYPWLAQDRMAAMPIGGDKDDFASIADKDRRPDGAPRGERVVELSYVGSYWPAIEPTLRALFRGAARLRTKSPDLARRLRLNFIGTDASTTGARAHVLPLAELEGAGGMVIERPQRLPYLEALAVTARSDGLLLLGSDEPHYTPSKIYSALMADRPYLSIFHAASSANDVFNAAGGGVSLSFEGHAELERLEAPISDALRALVLAPETLGRINAAAYSSFEAHAIATRFAGIFDQVMREAIAIKIGDSDRRQWRRQPAHVARDG